MPARPRADIFGCTSEVGDQGIFPVYEPDPEELKARHRAAAGLPDEQFYDANKEGQFSPPPPACYTPFFSLCFHSFDIWRLLSARAR